jgi:hypothetical protein
VSADLSQFENDGAPTSELLTNAVTDRCSNCQTLLASEQRYCVNCGVRRGKPRFTTESLATPASSTPVHVSERPPSQRPRFSSPTTVVAGVATLILAMGVGVLIGHDNTSPPTRAAAQQVITVSGGSGTGTSAGSASSAGTASAHGGRRSKTNTAAHKIKTTVVHVTPKVAKKAAAAATKVLGASAPKNPTVSSGQSCTAGAPGCQGGHFTGTFFGP